MIFVAALSSQMDSKACLTCCITKKRDFSEVGRAFIITGPLFPTVIVGASSGLILL